MEYFKVGTIQLEWNALADQCLVTSRLGWFELTAEDSDNMTSRRPLSFNCLVLSVHLDLAINSIDNKI
jgi:hypothetical protein